MYPYCSGKSREQARKLHTQAQGGEHLLLIATLFPPEHFKSSGIHYSGVANYCYITRIIRSTLSRMTMKEVSWQLQIITSTGTSLGAHAAHAQGISAILVSKFSPFDLLCDGALFRVANPTPLEDLEVEISKHSSSLPQSSAIVNKVSQKFSVLCTPLFNHSSSAIDFFYARTVSLVRKAKTLLENEAEATVDQLCQLKSEAEQLREAYDTWPATVPQEWIPKSVGLIKPKAEDTL